jgi:nucleoside 2-deoxyribosyltransferase
MNNKPNLYFAAPLFSKAELDFNKQIADLVQPYFDVYLPQEDGGLMVHMIAGGMQPEKAAEAVFNLDLLALKRCDLLLIVMDGRSVDEGAAFELGFAHALGKPCYALQTDPRRLLPVGNNPMLAVPLRAVFTQVDELLAWARSYSEENRPGSSLSPTQASPAPKR